MTRASIVAFNARAAHRELVTTTVAPALLRYAASALETSFRRQQARSAFRDAWRDYIAKVQTAAEYAIAEEQARQQLKVQQDDVEKRRQMMREADNAQIS